MIAKEYLQQIKSIDVKINLNLERLTSMKSRATYSGSANFQNTDVPTQAAKDRLSEEVCNIIMLDDEITEQIDRLANAKKKIISQLMQLHNADYIQILYKRYFDFKAWRQISTEMNYSESYLKMLHKQALEEFERLYSAEFCDLTV